MNTSTVTEKQPLLILSFHEPDSCGGFHWAPDTAENREHLTEAAHRDAEDFRDVILLAATLTLPPDHAPDDVTELLDRELVFESGRVGQILYRSPRWEDDEPGTPAS